MKSCTVLTPRKDTSQFLKVPGKTLPSPGKDKRTGSAQLGPCIGGKNLMGTTCITFKTHLKKSIRVCKYIEHEEQYIVFILFVSIREKGVNIKFCPCTIYSLGPHNLGAT